MKNKLLINFGLSYLTSALIIVSCLWLAFSARSNLFILSIIPSGLIVSLISIQSRRKELSKGSKAAVLGIMTSLSYLIASFNPSSSKTILSWVATLLCYIADMMFIELLVSKREDLLSQEGASKSEASPISPLEKSTQKDKEKAKEENGLDGRLAYFAGLLNTQVNDLKRNIYSIRQERSHGSITPLIEGLSRGYNGDLKELMKLTEEEKEKEIHADKLTPDNLSELLNTLCRENDVYNNDLKEAIVSIVVPFESSLVATSEVISTKSILETLTKEEVEKINSVYSSIYKDLSTLLDIPEDAAPAEYLRNRRDRKVIDEVLSKLSTPSGHSELISLDSVKDVLSNIKDTERGFRINSRQARDEWMDIYHSGQANPSSSIKASVILNMLETISDKAEELKVTSFNYEEKMTQLLSDEKLKLDSLYELSKDKSLVTSLTDDDVNKINTFYDTLEKDLYNTLNLEKGVDPFGITIEKTYSKMNKEALMNLI